MSTIEFLRDLALVLIGIGIAAAIIGRGAYILDRLFTRVTFGDNVLEFSKKVVFVTSFAVFIAAVAAFYMAIQGAHIGTPNLLIFIGILACVAKLMKFTGYFHAR